MSSADILVVLGPTIFVEIGFDPALIAQIRGAGAPPAAPPPAQNAAPPVPIIAIPPMQNVPALIDTGAGESCIDEALAQQLQLPLVNQAQTAGVHGAAMLNQYLAYISIPLLGTAQAGIFTGAALAAGGQIHRALIGRTLLRDTLLVYDGRTGSVKIAR